MSSTYKRLTAIETVDRLRACDFVDESRTADIIVVLTEVVGASTDVANLLMLRVNMETDHEAREAMRRFCKAAKNIETRGIA